MSATVGYARHVAPVSRAVGLVAALLAMAMAFISPATAERGLHAAPAVRLIMVDEPTCQFCRKWDAEIGGGYAQSAEGRFAPLHRVRRGAPELKPLAPVIYTPTFIVMRDGAEVGRVVGYPGKDYFYGELQRVLAEIGFGADTPQ